MAQGKRRRDSGVADLLLRNGRILDVFSGSSFEGDVAIVDDTIVGFGASDAQRTVDLRGAWVVPGLIDAHVHLESSQLSPPQFAAAVLPHGTTTVISDPHEIANVLGLHGIRYLLSATAGLPLSAFFMVPSCVPATHLETSGAILDAEATREVLGWERVIGLGEVMNAPGVLSGDPDLLAKLAAAAGRPIDGHAPGLSGPDLWAYILAGPRTDHECTTLPEAREKLQAGMHILIREGTTSRNLDALLPLLTAENAPFVHFCTDDRHPETLLEEGHIDGMLRRAIAGGIPPHVAIAAGTIHAARAYGLLDRGAVAPGYRADLAILSDLEGMRVDRVVAGGRLIAEGGRLLVDLPKASKQGADNTVRLAPESLKLSIPAGSGSAKVIGVAPDQVLTRALAIEPTIREGEVAADPQRDLLKLAVIERHTGSGRVGLGLVRGFGLRHGALGSSVAHDSHNLIVVGTNDEDLRTAARALADAGGGQVVVADGAVRARFDLPIAGLMSDRPLAEAAGAARALERAARELGCALPAPFMTLSFLALPVIPSLKLTDRGLVDVERFEIVPLFES